MMPSPFIKGMFPGGSQQGQRHNVLWPGLHRPSFPLAEVAVQLLSCPFRPLCVFLPLRRRVSTARARFHRFLPPAEDHFPAPQSLCAIEDAVLQVAVESCSLPSRLRHLVYPATGHF